jgi:hypothetical protein
MLTMSTRKFRTASASVQTWRNREPQRRRCYLQPDVSASHDVRIIPCSVARLQYPHIDDERMARLR